MAERAQSARATGPSGGEEPSVAELLDPIALERRLIEARARRAEALARRGKPPADAPPPETPPRRAGAEPAPPPRTTEQGHPEPERSGEKMVAALRRRGPATPDPTSAQPVTWPPAAGKGEEAPAAAPQTQPTRGRRTVLLLAAVFVAGLVGSVTAVLLAPPSLRQRLAEAIAPAGDLAESASSGSVAGPDTESTPAQETSTEPANVPAPPVEQVVAPAADVTAEPPDISVASPPEVPRPAGTPRRVPTTAVAGPAPISLAAAESPARPADGASSDRRLAAVPRPGTGIGAALPLEGAGGAPQAGLDATTMPVQNHAPAALALASTGASDTPGLGEVGAGGSPRVDGWLGEQPYVTGAERNVAALTTAPTVPEPVGIPARVALHYPAGSGSAGSAAVSALAAAGVTDVWQVEVPFTISETNARFFHGPDRPATEAIVKVLEDTLGSAAPARDFTDFRPQPEQGLVEVWIAGGPPASAATPPAPPATARQPPAPDRAAETRRPATGRAQPGLSGANRSLLQQNVERLLRDRLGN